MLLITLGFLLAATAPKAAEVRVEAGNTAARSAPQLTAVQQDIVARADALEEKGHFKEAAAVLTKAPAPRTCPTRNAKPWNSSWTGWSGSKRAIVSAGPDCSKR